MYNYQEQRAELFSESGVDMLLKIRANVERLIGTAGAVRAAEAWHGVSGDTWIMLAALDYMVERGEIREVTTGNTWAQHRVFVSTKERS
jgi:hypothetical protein